MKNSLKGTGTGRVPENIEKLRADLTTANQLIQALESELTKAQETTSRLLADDVRSSEEIAELKQLIWQSHRGLPGGCKCDICDEVDQSRSELEGFNS